MRRVWRVVRWVLLALLGLGALGIAGFVWWASDVPAPMPEALAALEGGAGVTVSTTDGDWLTFTPATGVPRVGLIYYPGGKVDFRSYAPYAQAIAEAGYLVAIPRVTLNLAITEIDAATPIRAAYPQVERWIVGGHSLGGASAAFYVSNQPEVAGLFLTGAYSSVDLSGYAGEVSSIYGTLDGLFPPQEVEETRAALPPQTVFVPLEGGNHAQFGWYGAQSGDNAATLAHDEQQAQTVAALLDLARRVEGAP